MNGNWHFLPSFVVQFVVTSLELTEMGAGARTEDPPLFIINGNGQFLPSFVLQVIEAGSKNGVREDAGGGAGAGADARTGVGAVEGALEPPLNPSHLSLQSTQGFGVP